ncbi:MAG: ATP-binding protein [Sporichthyaceae bacterium]|nr:ATP-binding protein [Sporichthyaceae bacterium]
MTEPSAHRRVHVDRVEELARFRDMVANRSGVHILLIQARSGMGKSSLLREFWEHSKDHPRVLVDFKSSSYSVEGVLADLCAHDPARFRGFFERLGHPVSAGPSIYINQSKITNSQFDIQQQMRSDSGDDREIRRQVLNQAYFADLVAGNPRGNPFVVMFDAYEMASDDVKDWLTRMFLSAARAHQWLVVVVAGQHIPQLGLGWDDWRLEQTLQPLGPEHVGEFVQHSELQLSADEIMSLYEFSEGIPLDLSIMIARAKRIRGATGG